MTEGPAVILDSGPLGLATNPKSSPDNLACNAWLQALHRASRSVYVPEIADYEVRRELLRAGKLQGLDRLDRLLLKAQLIPLNRKAMLRAAELWAQARHAGIPTADPKALDADVILAAQALTLNGVGEFIVASDNVAHLSRFVPTADWRDIEV